MALGSKLNTYVDGDTLSANNLNNELDNVYNSLDPAYIDDESEDNTAMRATADPGEAGTESLATTLQGEIQRLRFAILELKQASDPNITYWYESLTNDALGGVPVGSIIPWYDFGATISKPSNYVYCDGSTISDGDSPLNDETLPDLSNRYLVGFGTEDGEDIDSASWETDAVGNASHQVDLSHTHTGPSHTHDLGGTGYAKLALRVTKSGWEGIYTDDDSVTTWTPTTYYGLDTSGTSSANSNDRSTGVALGGATGSGGTGDTGSGGSATQSVQPRSVRVRFVMRIK